MTNKELLALICKQFGNNGDGLIGHLCGAVGDVNCPVINDDDDVIAVGTVIQAEDKDNDDDEDDEEEERVETGDDDDDDSDFLDEDDDNGGINMMHSSSQPVAGMKGDDNSTVLMEVVPGDDEKSFGTQEDAAMNADGGVDGDNNCNADGYGNYNAKIADKGDNANVADDDSENTNEDVEEDGVDASQNNVADADGDVDYKMDSDIVANGVDTPTTADIASVLAVIANLT